jgi:hypothetical protein
VPGSPPLSTVHGGQILLLSLVDRPNWHCAVPRPVPDFSPTAKVSQILSATSNDSSFKDMRLFDMARGITQYVGTVNASHPICWGIWVNNSPFPVGSRAEFAWKE